MTEPKEDPELIAIHPIESSMSGRNSVYNFCEERGQQVSYAVCLHTIRRIEQNDLPAEIAVECQRAYCHNNCIAKKHKAQEVAAGHALFFVPRPTHITDPVKEVSVARDGAVSSGKHDMSNDSYRRGWAIGGRDGYSADDSSNRARSKPARKVEPVVKKSGFVEATMADAINEMMKEPAKKAAPVPAATPTATSNSLRPEPGETTAEFIKRRAAMKGAK
jgi:hypothetical protein